jgi:hypothetical protein
MQRRVMTEKKFSTALSHEADVGVKWKTRAGLGPVERLDLACFVDRQDDGVCGRTHVKPHDVFDLFSEGRILGPLEGAQPVRLKSVLLPDALDRAQREACRRRHRPAGSVGNLSRRFGAGQRHHVGHRVERRARLCGFPLSAAS